jgi:hypothetical protein
MMEPEMVLETSAIFSQLTRLTVREDFVKIRKLSTMNKIQPITVVARSNAVIVGLNPTQDMDVCMRVYSVCVVLCVGRPCDGLIPRPRSSTVCVKNIT